MKIELKSCAVLLMVGFQRKLEKDRCTRMGLLGPARKRGQWGKTEWLRSVKTRMTVSLFDQDEFLPELDSKEYIDAYNEVRI